MDAFVWRPAPLGAERRVTLSGEGLAVDGGGLRRWADVRSVGFALVRSRRATTMTLELGFGDETLRLSVSGNGPEVARYVEMLRALTGALDEARPDLTIALGHAGGARQGLFAVGALGVVTGLGLIGIGVLLVVGRDIAGGLAMGAAGAVTALGCAGLALSNRPGAARREHPLSAFRDRIALPDS
jgi:hypothetical protein